MTLADAAPLVIEYRSRGVILDTNLLLLLVVGAIDPASVEHFKPTRNHGFRAEEFFLLQRIVSVCSPVVTTPHILTELSNHSDKAKGKLKADIFAFVSRLVSSLIEQSCPATQLCSRAEFCRLGLADTAISAIAPGQYLVLTVDFELAGHLRKSGVDVINFNHLRELGNLN